jgi:3-phytase
MKRFLTFIAVCVLQLHALVDQGESGELGTGAGQYSDLIVFGDTLSDMGNASQATFGLQPGPSYFDGRFSNGRVYAELLSDELGLEALTPSSSGGGNFAFGGARTSGTGGLLGLFIEDVDEQVDEFLAGDPVDRDALLVVFAGANDLLNDQSDISTPVSNLMTDLRRLISADGRQLLVLNLPPLGLAPRFNGDLVQATAMNEITMQFNAALWAGLDELETSAPDVNIFRLDVAELFHEVLADPETFGFVNVKDPAAPGLEPGDASYDTSLIVSDPNSYLFWDELHPTAAAHAFLAHRALAVVVPEPSGILLTTMAILAIATQCLRSSHVVASASSRRAAAGRSHDRSRLNQMDANAWRSN